MSGRSSSYPRRKNLIPSLETSLLAQSKPHLVSRRICKDVLSATCLYADFENGTPSLFFSIDEKWGDIEKVNPFRVKRITWDISNDKHSIIEEKTYS